MLSGCITAAPVVYKFPEVPQQLREACAELATVQDQEQQLSELLKTVTDNYSKYHECAVKQRGWVEWYEFNKNLINNIK